ncbi:protein pufQ [Rhodobacter sp. Har01]|uniref:cytochrome PufQ n=1 Tax=Rhodobacter sp. Har01 TaxID=2883999 RepID=UPI001D08005A|nr:cytochrome PufQ [Rhodobacter sp. Har01]MCB6176873.1 protein pufQ [Rhodobacter sp. Har01]
MSDQTASETAVQHAQRTPKTEFYIYFALIFVVAIPIAMVNWVFRLIVDRRLPVHGPLARAWREAGSITPAIFRP